MKTENIVLFLQTAYSDEKLAALLAHAQDGKLAYASCTCLVGLPLANHALMGMGEYCGPDYGPSPHLDEARYLPHAVEAEKEFLALGMDYFGFQNDALRRQRLIPLILAEQARREKLKPEITEDFATAIPLNH